MRKFALLAASMALVSQAAFAEPWTVGQQTITYTTSHPIKAHDTADAYTNSEPADISGGFTTTVWTHDTGDTPGPAGQFDGPGVGSQGKARFDCNAAFESHDDPILAPGVQNGASHDHTFFGNLGAQAAPYNATYASLRASGNSTCYGGPINRTLYWEPSLKKLLSNGAVVTVKPKNIVTYYEMGNLASIGNGTMYDPLVGSRWPRDISMIFGFNMSDPTDSQTTAAVAAGNAVSPGRYTTSSAEAGFVGWTCGSGYSPYLKNSDGSTPTNLAGCAAGTDISAEVISYPCWDGVNLHSPDGRLHFSKFIRDTVLSKDVCPDNWVRTVQFRAKVAFSNPGGISEFKDLYLSSDRMDANPANWYRNGETFHSDLIPAWDYGTAASPGIMVLFFVHCNGMSITISGTTLTGDGHECGTGRVSSDRQVWANEASPDGSQPNPLVNLSPDQRGYKRYFPATTGNPIPGTIKHDH